MPQLTEVQAYLWGSLPAHPVPLPVDRVIALVGANGSGKTTLLDAIKLLFGLTRFAAAGGREPEPRTPRRYLHRPPGDQPDDPRGEPVPWALVQGVFVNGLREDGTRPFEEEGRGTQHSEHVTVVARVTASDVRWTVLPGWRTWGIDGDREAEVRQINELPGSRWMKQDRYQQLLLRAGASRALFEVLALGQGEASGALSGDRREALRKVLQMLGQQRPLDKFAEERRRYAETQLVLEQAQTDLQLVDGQVRATEQLFERFKQWVAIGEHIDRLERTELPAALRRERAQQAAARDAARRELRRLEAREPALRRALRDADGRERDLLAQREGLLEKLADARGDVLAAESALAASEAAVIAHPDADEAAAASAREAARRAAIAADGARARQADLQAEAADLDRGRHRRPIDLATLAERLDAEGIEYEVLAESLDVATEDAARIDALLGDAVWALAVPAAKLEPAWAHAVAAGARVPLVRREDGFDAFVAELSGAWADLEIDEAGTVSGGTFRWLRGIDPPRVGVTAREAQARLVAEDLARLADELPRLSAHAEAAARDADEVGASVAAQTALSELRAGLVDAQTAAKLAKDAEGTNVDELRQLSETLTRDRAELDRIATDRANQEVLERRAEQAVARIDRELDRLAPVERPAGEAMAERSVDAINNDLRLHRENHESTAMFPPDTREPGLEERLGRQRRTRDEIAAAVTGNAQELELVNREVEEARAVFVETVQRSIRRLDARFRTLCDQAAMRGSVRIHGSEHDGYGLAVEVTATAGHGSAGLGSAELSGGQRAKGALVLLLACLSLEGAADILISDEPGAHMDARNLRDVGEAMERIAGDVQVIVSAPTDAEAERLDWSAHQITFWPTTRQDPDWPFVRLGITDRLAAE